MAARAATHAARRSRILCGVCLRTDRHERAAITLAATDPAFRAILGSSRAQAVLDSWAAYTAPSPASRDAGSAPPGFAPLVPHPWFRTPGSVQFRNLNNRYARNCVTHEAEVAGEAFFAYVPF